MKHSSLMNNKTSFLFLLFFLFTDGDMLPINRWEESNKRMERMAYVLKVGVLKFGEGHIRIEDDSLRPEKYISLEARSIGFFKFFYNAHYFFDASRDNHSGLPINATRIITQGSYKIHNTVTFDHITRTDSSIIHSLLTGTKVVEKNIYDILTAFYHFRDNLMDKETKPGDEHVITTYFTDQVWILKIRYSGRDTIRTIYGATPCLKFKPIAEEGRFFKDKNAISFWFTDDEHRIPVKAQINMTVGAITASLSDYEAL
ncbi:DUF3108 domain-containing protein [Marinilabiliaceae bacterium JC017]|nr:DUF3108 domain-containing protein [Marinilabiliaceae bacterium JC017]